MNVRIQPATLDGKHWIDVVLDGEATRYGPYANSTEAETTAARLAGVCRALNSEVILTAPGAKQHP